jgi:hypothetical protein
MSTGHKRELAPLRYHTGRPFVSAPRPDPPTFTPEQRAAHARIYAETGSKRARYMAGMSGDDGA